MAAAGEPGSDEAIERRLGHRTAYTLVLLLPFALSGLLGDLGEQNRTEFTIAAPAVRPATHGGIHIDLIALNEWEGAVTIRVTAHQVCPGACAWRDRYQFVSVYGDDSLPSDRPAIEVVTVPTSPRNITQTLRLPVFGDPIRYPFDRYQLVLGIVADRLFPDGSEQALTAEAARAYLAISLGARIPKVEMRPPEALEPSAIATDANPQPYVSVDLLSFQRPLYLKVLSGLLVLLVSAAAAYAVFMRPLDQLIINSGALVLGVWGIRAILLGSVVPGLTSIDLSLIGVILFLLITITVRTLWLLEERAGWHLLHRSVRRRRRDGKT